jgi:hypothetical protein
MGGMREFVGKLGTIIDNGERDGAVAMYRVKLDEPVHIARSNATVADDLWAGRFLQNIKPAPVFSEELRAWFDNFSQSAAVDMGSGGNNKTAVAETCITCIDGNAEEDLVHEFRAHIAQFGYGVVLKEARRHVRTL